MFRCLSENFAFNERLILTQNNVTSKLISPKHAFHSKFPLTAKFLKLNSRCVFLPSLFFEQFSKQLTSMLQQQYQQFSLSKSASQAPRI